MSSPTSLVGGNVVVDPLKAPGGWDYINSYTVVVKGDAFTAGGGFGGVAVPDQHNSPNKLGGPNGMATTPVDSTVVNTATATVGTQTATATASVEIVVPPPPVADLTIAKSHSGNFVQGQTRATYQIVVTNSGLAPTVGTVTVTDTLPPARAR